MYIVHRLARKPGSPSESQFLEMELYSNPAIPLGGGCAHGIFDAHVKCFGWNDIVNQSGDMVIEMDSVTKAPFSVFTSKDISTNWQLQFAEIFERNISRRLDLAQKEYESALQVTEEKSERAKEILYSLGTIAEAQGNSEGARSFYIRIYEIDIGYRDVAEKMGTLSG